MQKLRLFSKKKQPYWLYAIIAFGIIFALLWSFSGEEKPLSSKAVIIPVIGDVSSYGSSGMFTEESASAQTIINQIKQADEDPSIKAIIFEINSPGGTVVGSKEISDEIERIEKPTVAWLREVAASGAYWIAASTDKIVADPATITGSIGVTGSFLEFSGLLEKYGITYEEMTSGPYKEVGSPFKEMSNAERDLLQGKINALRDMFVEHISASRGMSRSKVLSLATGEIFLGKEAYEKGLVDVLGGREEAVSLASELVGEELKVVRYTYRKSLLERLTQSVSSSAYWVGRGVGDSFMPKAGIIAK